MACGLEDALETPGGEQIIFVGVSVPDSSEFALVVGIVVVGEARSDDSRFSSVWVVEERVEGVVSRFVVVIVIGGFVVVGEWHFNGQNCSAVSGVCAIEGAAVDENDAGAGAGEAAFERGSRGARLSAVQQVQDDGFAEKEAVCV